MFFLNSTPVERHFYNELSAAEVNSENSDKMIAFLAPRITKKEIYFLGRSGYIWFLDGVMFFLFCFMVFGAFFVNGGFGFILLLTAIFANKTFKSFFHFLQKPNKMVAFWIEKEKNKLYLDELKQIQQDVENADIEKIVYKDSIDGKIQNNLASNLHSYYKSTLDAQLDTYVKKQTGITDLVKAKGTGKTSLSFDDLKTKSTLYNRTGFKIVE